MVCAVPEYLCVFVLDLNPSDEIRDLCVDSRGGFHALSGRTTNIYTSHGDSSAGSAVAPESVFALYGVPRGQGFCWLCGERTGVPLAWPGSLHRRLVDKQPCAVAGLLGRVLQEAVSVEAPCR